MNIHRLDAQTIGRISAGEVIERPAAAVKELIENAIDANATRIDVTVEGGGAELIEVRDNGDGIDAAQLELAVERNATSKISSIDDLAKLRSLGFRGEALASIGSVSDLTIRSIVTGGAAGSAIRVQHGDVGKPSTDALGEGTIVQARNLFAVVPARRKFLRKPATETGYAQRITAAYALAYPNIAFSFTSDRKRSFSTDGRNNRISAAVAVWGRSAAEHLVEIDRLDAGHDGYSIAGVISLPSLDRANRQQQYLFVGGRLIASRQLTTAFEQAYHTLVMVGRHPYGCLLIDVPPDCIDVNVHPTKSEVRFSDDRLVFALVQRAVRQTLIDCGGNQEIPTIVSPPLAPRFIDPDVQRRLALAHPQLRVDRENAGRHMRRDSVIETEPVRSGGRSLPVLRVLGQVSAMFVIAEGPDGLYLIDQHAAHERILFEKVMNGYTAREVDRQQMLEPAIVTLTPAQQDMFEKSSADLGAIGFDLEEFGLDTVAIRGVPAMLKSKDPTGSLLAILEELIEGGRGDSLLESMAISAACHGSIRAGQPLSLLEMRELVEQLEACSSPLACGHGRPTIIRLTAEELERQFARR